MLSQVEKVLAHFERPVSFLVCHSSSMLWKWWMCSLQLRKKETGSTRHLHPREGEGRERERERWIDEGSGGEREIYGWGGG